VRAPPPRGRPRSHRGRAPDGGRDDGQGHVRLHQPRRRGPGGGVRPAGGQRGRGGPGAHRPAVRRQGLRVPRPGREHGPDPGAPLMAKDYTGFSAAERKAMQDRAKELALEAEAGKLKGKAKMEKELFDRIAEMPDADRTMAEKI